MAWGGKRAFQVQHDLHGVTFQEQNISLRDGRLAAFHRFFARDGVEREVDVPPAGWSSLDTGESGDCVDALGWG